ncbi:MAG: 4-hydroxy-3-methylbut-2-enyl diphosphate reductase [Acidobacteria bacterium]|nr:4-hydroxy-3-methylbut-2-enyl diphosphate reductase [Acidobacteriota bacterium]
MFRKGFGLGGEIAPELARDYHSALVKWFRDNGGSLTGGETTLLLASELGFCYGVDRAVEYAYETRHKFPDRRIHITGEIIHNPHVNKKLREMEIHFLSTPDNLEIDLNAVQPGDVVILPAFGARVEDLDALRQRGAVLVDTTCGSVLNVWKNVQRNARDGFTSVIHGKVSHEETRATASWARGTSAQGHYLVVRDMGETEDVCRYIEERGKSAEFRARFQHACSPGFDPELHLCHVGVANQTTMLSSESLAIARRLGQALTTRYGATEQARRFRSFDTICSATQERQDAVVDLLAMKLDLLVVIGGYNSSNTNHLAELSADHGTPAFHIEDFTALKSDGSIRYQPVRQEDEIIEPGWLPQGPVRIGVTAGASTPNNRIGEVLATILNLRRVALPVEAN